MIGGRELQREPKSFPLHTRDLLERTATLGTTRPGYSNSRRVYIIAL